MGRRGRREDGADLHRRETLAEPCHEGDMLDLAGLGNAERCRLLLLQGPPAAGESDRSRWNDDDDDDLSTRCNEDDRDMMLMKMMMDDGIPSRLHYERNVI